MSTDLDTMAARLVDDVGDVRSCVILTSEGTVLSAAPIGAGPRSTGIVERFKTLGDVKRGFLAMGDELYVMLVHGGRTGLLVAETTAAPGLLLEQLELLLESGAATTPETDEAVSLAEVAPGAVAEAAEAVLEKEISAGLIGTGLVADSDVDPMALVREFAGLAENHRHGE